MKKLLLLFSMIAFFGVWGLQAQNPEEPTEFKASVAPDGQGGYKVQLSALTPTQYRYSGPDIPPGTQVKMVFTRSSYALGESDVEINTQMVAPGTLVSCEDTGVQKGIEYTYYCYAYVGENSSWGASIYGLYIGIKPEAPSITATTTDEGMPPVTITVTAPEKTATGDPLTSNMTLKIVTSGASYGDPDIIIATFENVAPGETRTYDYTPSQLSRTFSFGALAETADGISDKGQTSVYVGRDLPSAPENVSLAKNEDGSVTISWTAPLKGQQGGSFAMPLYYDVTRNDGTVIITKTEATSATDNCADITSPTEIYYSVRVYNEDGGNASTNSDKVIVGPAASLPFYESFGSANGYYKKPDNTWEYDSNIWDFLEYTWAYDVEPVLGDEDGMAECYFSTYNGQPYDRHPLTSFDISFENASNPTLTFSYAPLDAPNSIAVEVIKGEETIPVASFNVNEGVGEMWREVSVSLKQFAGEKAVKISIVPTGGPDFKKNEYVYIDEIRIADVEEREPFKNGSGSTLRGFVSFDEADTMQSGWYELDTYGTMNLLWEWNPELANMGFVPRGGWIRDGKLCMIVGASMGSDQLVSGFGYVEINPTNGAVLKSENLNPYENVYMNMISLAYVEAEDKIYGIAQDTESSTCYMVEAPASDLTAAKEIVQLPSPGNRAYSFAYSPEEECFYGISYFDKLTRYDKDGTLTEVAAVPMSGLTSERGALVYSPLDGAYVYCPQYNTNGYAAPCEFYAVDPVKKSFERYFSRSNMVHIPFMVCPDNFVLEAKSPAMPVVKSIVFTAGSLNADVTYQLPVKAHDGSDLSGSLEWVAKVGNTEFSTGSAKPGDEVTVKFSNLSDGPQALQLVAISGNLQSLPGVARLFAGKDSPKAPENVAMTTSKVTWDAVTAGVHGEKIELGSLTYNVYLNDVLQGTTPDTEYEIILDAQKPMTAYVASIVAVAGGMQSEPGYSNKVIFGKPYDLPMHFAPTEDDFALMTVYNVDGGPDYGIWEYSERWDKPCFSSGWSLDKDADDWLILPGASFKSTELAARLSFQAACGGSSGKEEYLEVWMGNAPDPESMTIPIITKTQIRSMEWETYENIFSVPSAGTYYIGFHSVSKPNQYSLNICEITVEQTDLNAHAPSVVSGLKVISTSNADLTATVSFVLPTTDLTGAELSGTVTAKVTCGENYVEVSGESGSTQQATVKTSQGNNVIFVVCTANGLEGQKAEIQAFTGVDLPDFVENYTTETSEDNMSLIMKWEAPLKGYNDGYFEKTGLQYYVGELDDYGDFIDEPVLVGTDVFEYTYTLKPGAEMDVRYIAVAAGNAAGISPCRWYARATIGTPYTPPMEEGFDNMQFTYKPITRNAPDERYSNGSMDWAQPELIDPAYDHGRGDYALVGYCEEGSARIWMNLPKFSTLGDNNLEVVLDMWNGNGRPSEVSVYASTYGVSATKIATIPAGTGWEQCKVDIPAEFIGRPWVTISIDAALPDASHYLILSGYSVGKESGVSSIENSEEPARYFTIDGLEVINPEPGHIYIRIRGNKSEKVIFR